MTRENPNLDQFFKEKLSQDSIRPSKLAWERLESQLPQQEKKRTPVIWWAAAASVAVLLTVGYFTSNNSSVKNDQQLLTSATENPIEEVIDQKTETQTESSLTETPEKIITQKENKTKPTHSTPKISNSTKPKSSTANLIAVADEKPELKKDEKQSQTTPIVEELDLPPLKLPSLQVNQTVANVEQTKVEEPAYRVKIYSDGLEEDKTLINGISKKVEKVEGFLGKVDQGFADLQDAKSNLFTALLSKKEKPAEKP